WVVTNLRPTAAAGTPSSSFSWVFDLKGISEMYQSYEETNLCESMLLKESAADGGGGVEMHVLEDAGHWVHADNPDGLFRILSFSFKGVKA
ncbi:hypothetical protein POUND7_007536, partial [Theobroma cacao]